MTPRDAARILNLVHPVTEAAVVRAAFAVTVRANHPDTADPLRPAWAQDPIMDRLKKARDVLLAEIAARPDPYCPACRGSGWVAEGFRKMRCPRGC